MAETKNMICTVCPVGCRLNVEMNSGEILKITGNTCNRGIKYATAEILNPVRTLTSTVRIHGAAEEKLLPVRTDSPIPKDSMFDAMKLIKAINIDAPVNIGDVIIRDFINDGVNLIACKSVLG